MRQTYPSSARFALGTLGTGISCGITLALALTEGWFGTHLTKAHRYEILYGMAVCFIVAQMYMLRKWRSRMERDKEILDDLLLDVQPEMDRLMDKVARRLNERS
jgi:hypothetical protein